MIHALNGMKFSCVGYKWRIIALFTSIFDTPRYSVAGKLSGRTRLYARFCKTAHPKLLVIINQPFLQSDVFGVEFKPRIPLTPFSWHIAILTRMPASAMTKYALLVLLRTCIIFFINNRILDLIR